MKRESIYIDTSVPSAYYDLREPVREFNLKQKLFLPEIVIPTEIVEEV